MFPLPPIIIIISRNNYKLGGEASIGGGGVGWWLGSGSGTGVQKPDELVILRNQNQTLLSIRISAAVFISVIVYPVTLQFVTISFFFKNARAYCTFYIYLAKPLSFVHVSNNRSNTDCDPQDIPLHSRMVNKIG